MSEILLSTIAPRDVKDATVRRFADDVGDIMKLEVLQAVGAQQAGRTVSFAPAPPQLANVRMPAGYALNTVGAAVQRYVATLPAPRRQQLARNLNVTPRLAAVRQRLAIDTMAPTYVLGQGNLAPHVGPLLTPAFLQNLGARLHEAASQLAVPQNGSSGSHIAVNQGVRLELVTVKCVDDTDTRLFGLGKDTIDFGGVATDANGHSSRIRQFRVGDFLRGHTQSYSPPRPLHAYSFGNGPYPRMYTALIAIAEINAVGFADLLHDLYDAVRDEITVLAGALGQGAAVAVAGGLGAPTVGGLAGGTVGDVFAAIVAVVMDDLVAFIIGALQDSLFEPQLVTITLPDQYAKFDNGSLVSPNIATTFADFGGNYRVKYRWVLQ